MALGILGFQSLIGRLQTAVADAKAHSVKKFQSLIGRLQTGHDRGRGAGVAGFQSLIGRLQTFVVVVYGSRPSRRFNPS